MGFSLGGLINSVTGATNSAQRQQDYAVHMNKLNFNQQKYFAQNAHQMEMEDLRKAGLNPALTATGGSGASASGGGGGTGTGGASGSGNPFDILNTIVSMSNQTSATNSQNALNKAQAIKTIAEANNIPYQNKIAMMNAISAQMTAEANTTNANENKKDGPSRRNKNWADANNADANARYKDKEYHYIGWFPRTKTTTHSTDTYYRFYDYNEKD